MDISVEFISQILDDFSRIAKYDHSVSVPQLGSIFHFDPGTPDPVGELQKRLAQIYGVRFAWVSTNGTTPLNVMSLMAVTSPNDRVLVQRDSHISVFAPMIHMDLRPVYLCPPYSEELGINLGITVEQLHNALDCNPDVKAVFLTYPNYFGIATDLSACAELVRERGIPLIVDAAHGAYLRFHPALPLAAEHTGADIVTQSTHKTGAALSQASVALFNNEGPIERFYEIVNQLGFMSTSFSYVILLSASLAALQLELQGAELLSEMIEVSAQVRSRINQIRGLRCFGQESTGPGFLAIDPLRITVDVSQLGMTGFEVENLLIERFHLYPEMATLRHVLFLLTPADDDAAGQRIVQVLRGVAGDRRICRPRFLLPPPAVPRQLVAPRAAFYSRPARPLPVRSAIGLPSAETIAAYPPGSPIVVAGEEITTEIVEYLAEVRRSGGVLKGASSPDFATIRVLESK